MLTRMAPLLTRMLTRMTRWLAGSLARWLAYYTHSFYYS